MMVNKYFRLCKYALLSKSCSPFFFVKDFLSFRKNEGVSIDEYNNYELYNRDTVFRDTFLSYRKAEQYWQILNPEQYAVLARDKYLTHLVLEKKGIPMPKLWFAYNPECANTTDTVNSYDSLVERLSRISGKIVIKPMKESAHGDEVYAGTVCFMDGDPWLESDGGKRTSIRQMLTQALLFEECLETTNQMASMNPSSCNTLRMMTALYPDYTAKLIACFYRAGRKGSVIDNAGKGGNVMGRVDIVTGEMNHSIDFQGYHDVIPIHNHPDSGIPLDFTINDWEKITNCVTDWQTRLDDLKVIGWDVALTNKGPVIIEINHRWDTLGQLVLGRGWKQEVADCYQAWMVYKR